MPCTITSAQHPSARVYGAAGPELAAAVLRALCGRATAPAVAAAAHILSAEVITAACESCFCATSPGELCSECQARSERAAAHRLAAADLQAEHGLLMQA